jgi:outer membrane protein
MTPSVVLQGSATDGPLGAPAFGPLGNPLVNGTPALNLQGLAGDPVKKQFGAGLTASLPLFDFGRTQHAVAARRESLRAAEQDTETEKAQVLVRVQQAYLNVMRVLQLRGVQQENLKQRETTLRQARLLVEAQLKAGIDVQLAQANAAEANVALIAAENEVSYALTVLNNSMGDTKLVVYDLDTVTLSSPASSPNPLEAAMLRAVAQRPELKSMTFQRDASEQNIRSVRSELLPRFDAVASLGVINPSAVIKNSQNYAVGLAVSIPLTTGGAVEGRIAEEKQRRGVLEAQERELRETIKLQVSRTWLDVQTREAQVVSAREQAVASETSLRLASERYRLQLNSLVELTDAEVLTIRARAQLIDARYDLEVARALLNWATGDTYLKYMRPAGGGRGRTGGRP